MTIINTISIKNECEKIIKYYKNYRRLLKKKNYVGCKRLVFINMNSCDICEKITINETNIIVAYMNQGIQICDNCLNNYPKDMYIYNIALINKLIPHNKFLELIKVLNNNFTETSIYIKRTSGDIELWKLDRSKPIYIDTGVNDINIPVIDHTEVKTKGVLLSEITKLNNIDIDMCNYLFESIYYKVLK